MRGKMGALEIEANVDEPLIARALGRMLSKAKLDTTGIQTALDK
jgi:hypothetical protein